MIRVDSSVWLIVLQLNLTLYAKKIMFPMFSHIHQQVTWTHTFIQIKHFSQHALGPDYLPVLKAKLRTHTLSAAGTVSLLPPSWCFQPKPTCSLRRPIRRQFTARANQSHADPVKKNSAGRREGDQMIAPPSSTGSRKLTLPSNKRQKKIKASWRRRGETTCQRRELSSVSLLWIVCINRLRTHDPYIPHRYDDEDEDYYDDDDY